MGAADSPGYTGIRLTRHTSSGSGGDYSDNNNGKETFEDDVKNVITQSWSLAAAPT